MAVVPEFLALTFALSVYTATYIAEAIRSGIEAVDKGQKEAAAAIGLSPVQSLKLIVLPQALRVAIPPTINNLSHPFFRGRLVCASITGRIAAFAFGPPTLMDLGGSYWLTIIRHWHCLSGVCATTVAGIANSPMALITSILSTRMGLRWSLPTLIFNPIHNISAAQPQRHC